MSTREIDKNLSIFYSIYLHFPRFTNNFYKFNFFRFFWLIILQTYVIIYSMDIEISDNNIVITNQPDFELSHIFDCGQCFRFDLQPDGSYIGTAYGRTIKLSKQNNEIILHDTSYEDFKSIWYDYLDLGRDYTAIKAQLTQGGDEVMKTAALYGSGIRILNQDMWEAMISFIISASNNIPRIKKIISLLCSNFGTAHEYMGKTFYSFPTAERIAELSLEDLSVIRAGFRDKYILDCAKKVASGEIDLTAIKALATPQAKKVLMSIYGIGNKVSDCILLFGMGRFDSFPVDVWIKRVMEYCYFGNTEQPIKTISQYAEEHFGELGGIAQQYLFFYAREQKIGT